MKSLCVRPGLLTAAEKGSVRDLRPTSGGEGRGLCSARSPDRRREGLGRRPWPKTRGSPVSRTDLSANLYNSEQRWYNIPMPELPEVETIVNGLRGPLIGRTFTGVRVGWENIVAKPAVPEFQRRIRGRQILGIRRRGKYLIFDLSGGNRLLIHLKMTGQLAVRPGHAPAPDCPPPRPRQRPGGPVRTCAYRESATAVRRPGQRQCGHIYRPERGRA